VADEYVGLANELAKQGRYGDTTLIHVNPVELQGLASAYPGMITRNPKTGLPEAWIPLVAGALLGAAGAGIMGPKDVPLWQRVLVGAAGGAVMGYAGGALAGAGGAGAAATTPVATTGAGTANATAINTALQSAMGPAELSTSALLNPAASTLGSTGSVPGLLGGTLESSIAGMTQPGPVSLLAPAPPPAPPPAPTPVPTTAPPAVDITPVDLGRQTAGPLTQSAPESVVTAVEQAPAAVVEQAPAAVVDQASTAADAATAASEKAADPTIMQQVKDFGLTNAALSGTAGIAASSLLPGKEDDDDFDYEGTPYVWDQDFDESGVRRANFPGPNISRNELLGWSYYPSTRNRGFSVRGNAGGLIANGGIVRGFARGGYAGDRGTPTERRIARGYPGLEQWRADTAALPPGWTRGEPFWVNDNRQHGSTGKWVTPKAVYGGISSTLPAGGPSWESGLGLSPLASGAIDLYGRGAPSSGSPSWQAGLDNAVIPVSEGGDFHSELAEFIVKGIPSGRTPSWDDSGRKEFSRTIHKHPPKTTPAWGYDPGKRRSVPDITGLGYTATMAALDNPHARVFIDGITPSWEKNAGVDMNSRNFNRNLGAFRPNAWAPDSSGIAGGGRGTAALLSGMASLQPSVNSVGSIGQLAAPRVGMQAGGILDASVMMGADPTRGQLQADEQELMMSGGDGMSDSVPAQIMPPGPGGMDVSVAPSFGEADAVVPETNAELSDQQMLLQIVVDAKSALEGTHPNPEEAIVKFLEVFGEAELESLKVAVMEERGQGGEPEQIAVSGGEYIVDASAVSDLGNGDTNAGAQRLDDMVNRIRTARHGTEIQPPQIFAEEVLPV